MESVLVTHSVQVNLRQNNFKSNYVKVIEFKIEYFKVK